MSALPRHLLLTTKISIPPLRSARVARPRLLSALRSGASQKLTLVSAPAGSGKTTLLAAWAADSGLPIAWYSIDEADNTPERFLAYLAAALQNVIRGAGDEIQVLLRAPQFPSQAEIVASLINPLTEAAAPLYLVLDDYHLISDPAIQALMILLIERQPPNLHMILATRSDPPWPLARWRARAEICELHAQDLRFSIEEAVQFLNETCGIGLSSAEVTRIEARTEGWAAGLQMAALILREPDQRALRIENFTGSQRLIVDYLFEEVLARQPAPLRHFLLVTSLLDRLTAPLCDALLAQESGSAAILAQLEAANLFLVALDHERRWYRYHHLFRDALRIQGAPLHSPELHLCASRWLAAHGLTGDAIRHALAGGDMEQVAGLVADNALSLIDFGELNALANQLDAHPAQSQPWLSIAHAWTLAYTGKFERAEQLLAGIDLHSAPPDLKHLQGHQAAILAYIRYYSGAYATAIQFVHKALENLPASDHAARAMALTVLGSAQVSVGLFEQAGQALSQAIQFSRDLGQTQVYVMAASWYVYLLKQQSQLRRASEVCQMALDFCRRGDDLPSTASLYLNYSNLLVEFNDLPAALASALKGFELAKRWGQADTLVFGHLQLATAYQLMGESDQALKIIRQGREIARRISPWFEQECVLDEAWLRLLQDNPAASAQLIRESGLRPDDALDAYALFKYTILALQLLADGQTDQAEHLLERMLCVAERAGAQHSRIQLLNLLALIQKQEEAALSFLRQSLELASLNGYTQTFLLRGAAMHKLLQKGLARGICPEYTRRLLAAFEHRLAHAQPAPPPPDLIDPLSQRERDILLLLAQSLSAPEIARRLFLSANTVRTHIKSIYAKLGVHTRWQLVEQARRLGLLDT